MNKLRCTFLLAAIAAAGTPSIAQDDDQTRPGTVIIEHGDDRIVVHLGDGGKPKVRINGRAVDEQRRNREKGVYDFKLREYLLRVAPPEAQIADVGWWRQAPAAYQWLAEAQKHAGERPFIGVQVGSVTEALAYHMGLDATRCVLVLDVTKDGPAAKAGLQANDVLVRIGDERNVTNETLSAEVAKRKPGDKLEAEIVRRGNHEVLQLEVVADPVKSAAGAWPTTLDPRFKIARDQIYSVQSTPAANTLYTPSVPWTNSALMEQNAARFMEIAAKGGNKATSSLQTIEAQVGELRDEVQRIRELLERNSGEPRKKDR